MKIEHLTQPIKIGKMEIRNRMAMPPMNTNYSDINGCVTRQMADYYVRRSKGGVGLITVEAAAIEAESKNHGVQPMLYDEKFIPEWHNMVERIQQYGAKVTIEIVHYGSEGALGERASASDVSSIPGANIKVLTKEEILEMEDKFVHTVCNAKAAGFDAVTLHAAHGYLLAEFLSPLYNHRTDEYGGSIENRCRFLVETIQKCKKATGGKYPVFVRMSGEEYFEGGRGIEEGCEFAKLIEAAGADAIDVCGGIAANYVFGIAPYSLPGIHGLFVENARKIKQSVNIPVIVAGGIRTPEMAEQILVEGSADIVALGRTLIADPDFCNKVIEGRLEDIRQCLTCQNCFDSLAQGRSIRCALNAEAGREYEFTGLTMTANPKKIAIIGGGPAGMEAARIASMRGHRVTIVEKEAALGGKLNVACVPPHKDKIGALVKWYEIQLRKLGVSILLNTIWSEEVRAQLDPDEVLVAAGTSMARFIKGSESAYTANEVLADRSLIGENVIIIGGGATGSETAETIADERVDIKITAMKNFSGELNYEIVGTKPENKKKITIVEMLPDICMDMDDQNKTIMKLKLKVNGVNNITNAKVLEIGKDFVVIEHMETGKSETLVCDTVILAGGLLPERPVEYGKRIGDSKTPGKIVAAIRDGYELAREI